jgi:hypothetical protein
VRVSKGGQQYDWLPPFETRRFATLLRVRLLFYLEANAPLEWRAPSKTPAGPKDMTLPKPTNRYAPATASGRLAA